MYESTYVVGHTDGEKKGKMEGKSDRNLEIAKTMLAKGFDVQSIMEITGLDKKNVLMLGKTA